MSGIHKTKIRNIVSRQVVRVTPETSVGEALGVMAAARISCLVVAAGRKPLGIFTERDAVKMASRGIPASQAIAGVMTAPVITIPGDLTVIEAYNLMLTNHIRHHVVVNRHGWIIGVMSQSDLINRLGLEYFVEMRRVEQVMSIGVVTLPFSSKAADAVAAMARSGFSCVVVAADRSPAGIVTERDAVRLVAAGADLARTAVEEVMTAPVQTVQVGETVHRAAVLMKQERIRRVVVIDGDGRIAGIVTQSDIVKGLEGQYVDSLKEIIREKEDIFRQTANELLDKTVYLDNILTSSLDLAIIATDADFRIKYYNPAAEEIFGLSAASAIGRCATEIHEKEGMSPLPLQKARETVHRKGKTVFSVRREKGCDSRQYDGGISGIRDRQGHLVGFVVTLHDVTERIRQEETIRHLAYHDSLTGLPNRILLNDRLSQALVSSSRSGACGALMILDLDRFKDVNDTLGHSMGDLLLKGVAERLRGILRKSDTVSRMGGDEFVLLLPSIASPGLAEATARRIVREFRKPFVCDGKALNVTASVGIADFSGDGRDAETLLKNADIALYRVKETGRDGYCRYGETEGMVGEAASLPA